MIRIISFSGLDGSGKSTQVASITKLLENNGHRVFYFHATQFSLSQRLKDFFKNTHGERMEKSQTKANFLGRLLRTIVLPVDLLRFEVLLRRLRRQGYDYLISDRYFYDSLINIAYLSGKNSILPFPIRKPSAAFYINSKPTTIMSRERTPEQGMLYLKEKKIIYDYFAKDKGLYVVNGDKQPSRVTIDVVSYLHRINVVNKVK